MLKDAGIKFIDARRIFGWHLRHDDDLRLGYEANIAMLLSDRYGITNFETRLRAANDILNLMFFNVGREPVALAMAKEYADEDELPTDESVDPAEDTESDGALEVDNKRPETEPALTCSPD